MGKIVYNNFKLKIKFEKAFHSEAVLNHFFSTFFADFRLTVHIFWASASS